MAVATDGVDSKMPRCYHASMQRLGLRFPDELYEALREIAHRERTSINALVVAATAADEEVRREIERQGKTA